jgi:Integrase core domain
MEDFTQPARRHRRRIGRFVPSTRVWRGGSLFIDPGSPWQNAWIESFNGGLGDELLNSWRFNSPGSPRNHRRLVLRLQR